MSLLVPNERDHVDAHEDLDQDELYYKRIAEIRAKADVLNCASTSESSESDSTFSWDFEPVQGFFMQTSDNTDDMKFNYATQGFGTTKPWEELIDRLELLNSTSVPNTKYKMLFLARHGQGWHNIASHKYPKADWFSRWRFVGTDGEIEWGPDAKLTDLGISQAKENGELWKSQLENGAPLPTKFYVSPLLRSIDTLFHTWRDIEIPRPIVIENVRETIGVHLCHERTTKSALESKYTDLDFEEGFTEDDLLAQKYSTVREQLHQQFLRVDGVLQKIFDEDEDSIISITSHAGTIRGFITVIGHRKFTIPTGGMIPIVVKGTKNNVKRN